MSFKELYEYRRDWVSELSLPTSVGSCVKLFPIVQSVVSTSLNVDVLLGAYMAPENEDTLYTGAPPGAAAVIVNSNLNYCWARFVQLKELMHLFDNPHHFTNNADEFESLVVGMCEPLEPTGTRSGQIQSEYECMWMSLALCCSEERRVEFQRLRSERKIADAAIAELLKMPERFVPILFEAQYKTSIGYLLQRR